MRYLLFICIIFLVTACDKNKQPTPDITSNLVVDIPLDASAIETVYNSSGTIYGATPTINRKGEPNKAMLFNGSDSNFIDFGALPMASLQNGRFTISCWFKVTDQTNTLAILSKRSPTGPYEYSIDNHFDSHFFNFDNWIADGSHTVFGIDPLQTKAPYLLNTWHHLVIVDRDVFGLVVYVDGKLQPGQDYRQQIDPNQQVFGLSNYYNFSATSAHFIIGNGGAYGNQHYFTGAIDDIKIYNRTLDDVSIKELYKL